MLFRANPNFAREVSKEPAMRVFLSRVAEDAADEVESRAPNWIKRAGATFEGRVEMTARGYEGEARVDSSFWHLPEFGSSNSRPTPYLRPGVQAALSRYGGRLGE